MKTKEKFPPYFDFFHSCLRQMCGSQKIRSKKSVDTFYTFNLYLLCRIMLEGIHAFPNEWGWHKNLAHSFPFFSTDLLKCRPNYFGF